MTGTSTLRLYGRRKGKRLRRSQQLLLQDLLPRIQVADPEPGTALDLRGLFTSPCEDVWLEIGFGGGEHLAALARKYPAVGLVGCEPFINGVVKLLSAVDEAGLENVRIYPDDGRALLEAIRPGSIGRVFALFPDPWPKMRHRKRRLLQAGSLELMARALADGGSSGWRLTMPNSSIGRSNRSRPALPSPDPRVVRAAIQSGRATGRQPAMRRRPSNGK